VKTILEFDLPEDREELDAVLKGSLYKVRIDELYAQVFRVYLKYNKPIIGTDSELSEEQREVIEALWKKVAEHFEDVLE
jgi:hypothetical protein